MTLNAGAELVDDLVDLATDLLVALQFHHVGETFSGRHINENAGSIVPIRDVLHEQIGSSLHTAGKKKRRRRLP